MRPAVRLCCLLVTAAVVGTSCGDNAAEPVDPAAFASSIDIGDLTGHLAELQRIADGNGGNRAAGTPGFDASVEYVAAQLRDAGFTVETPEFEFSTYEVVADSVHAGDAEFDIRTFTFSPATPPDGIRAPLVALAGDRAHGCEAGDYAGVSGAIVVVARGECPFVQKETLAADAGAAAVLVTFADDAPGTGTLGKPGLGEVPIARIDETDLPSLLAAGTDVTLRIDAATITRTTRNVIAQTETGSRDDVVMVGAHLDSVPEGPGINDNGSGVATILDIATELGSSPAVTNAVRFAWWGGEELGLLGSDDYVERLAPEDRARIALYLNFDMLGSPNAGYLTYDGDNSDAVGDEAGPDGSAGIERTFNSYFRANGIVPDGTDFDGRSDYGAFVEHRIPSGGVFSGAEEDKTLDQQRKWGGTADAPFDPNYHQAGDTLANIDTDALETNARAAAFGVASYAMDITGADGVPGSDERAVVRGDDE